MKKESDSNKYDEAIVVKLGVENRRLMNDNMELTRAIYNLRMENTNLNDVINDFKNESVLRIIKRENNILRSIIRSSFDKMNNIKILGTENENIVQVEIDRAGRAREDLDREYIGLLLFWTSSPSLCLLGGQTGFPLFHKSPLQESNAQTLRRRPLLR